MIMTGLDPAIVAALNRPNVTAFLCHQDRSPGAA